MDACVFGSQRDGSSVGVILQLRFPGNIAHDAPMHIGEVDWGVEWKGCYKLLL